MRLNFLLSLLTDVQQFLDGSLYKANSLIVSYKLGFEAQAFSGLLAAVTKQAKGDSLMAALTEHYLGLPEKQRAAILRQIEVDVQRSLQDFQRHTNQVFYLAREKVSTIFDQHVLSLQQRQLLPESYVQLYHLVSIDIYLTQ